MKKWICLVAAITAILGSVAAGDMATLVNLGFSPDSGHFMFGFYGLDTSTAKPYAEIYLVDTKKNEYVKDGAFRGMYAVDLEPGWNPSGALYKLLANAIPVATRYKIDHLQQGRLVYLAVEGPGTPDTLSFKDFKTGEQWNVVLKESVEQKNGSVTSSFGLELSITGADGKARIKKAGNPAIKRQNVSDYSIHQIIVAPDGKTAAALIERKEKNGEGFSLRYMVETFRLP